MPRRSAWILLAATVSLATTAVTAPSGADGVPRHPAPPWSSRLVVRGQFSGLQVVGDGMLATGARGVTSPSPTVPTHLYRLNADGAVLARSDVVPDDPPTLVGDALWVVTGSLGARPRGAFDELQPSTLRTEARVSVRANVASSLLATTTGATWVLLARKAPMSCVVARVLLAAPTVRLLPTRTLAGGCVLGVVDSSGTEVFVLTGWQTSSQNLYRLSARSGALEASTRIPAIAGLAPSMVASPSRVWIAGGGQGANGDLRYLGARHLNLLNQSSQGGGTLPTYSQWPSVGLSGGRVWVASWGVTSCFRPSNAHQLSGGIAHGPPYVSSSLVVVQHRTWGIADSGYGAYGIVRVQPPAACLS